MTGRILILLATVSFLSGCHITTADRGMPQQVRLYPDPGFKGLGNNEDGFDRRLMNCSGGDRLRGWC